MFLNRPGFDAGPGCALHLPRMQTGQHFAATKPDGLLAAARCARFDRRRGRRHRSRRCSPSSGATGWGEGGEEFAWWCTEAPEAFTAHEPVYRTLEPELRLMLGERLYAQVAAYLDTRRNAQPAPVVHPAEVKLLKRKRKNSRAS